LAALEMGEVRAREVTNGMEKRYGEAERWRIDD
jgi:hypothetical protein